MILEPGDFVFTGDNSSISETIKAASDGEVSHVAIYIGNGLVLESSWSGVVITGLKKYLNKDTKCIAVKLPDRIDRHKFVEALCLKCGDEYDYKLLLGQFVSWVFRIPHRYLYKFDSPNKWLCYEVISKELENQGEVFNVDIRKLNPQSLLEIYRKEGNSWTL